MGTREGVRWVQEKTRAVGGARCGRTMDDNSCSTVVLSDSVVTAQLDCSFRPTRKTTEADDGTRDGTVGSTATVVGAYDSDRTGEAAIGAHGGSSGVVNTRLVSHALTLIAQARAAAHIVGQHRVHRPQRPRHTRQQPAGGRRGGGEGQHYGRHSAVCVGRQCLQLLRCFFNVSEKKRKSQRNLREL